MKAPLMGCFLLFTKSLNYQYRNRLPIVVSGIKIKCTTMKNFPILLSKLLSLIFILLSLYFLNACHSAEKETVGDLNSSNLSSLSETKQKDSDIKEVTASGRIRKEAKIIRQASVRFQVKDYQKSTDTIQSLLQHYGAFLASSNDTRQDEKLETTMIIQVPSQDLEKLLKELMNQSVYLDYKNISSEDVSGEFIDISARLKAKQVVEQRFLDLLKDAKKLDDIFTIEKQLLAIREEIEATQARINYLQEHVSYSTITLEIYEHSAANTSGNNFLIRVVNALAFGWNLLLSLMIGLLYIWPILAIFPIAVYLMRKFIQKYPPVR